jgi:DNA-binding CsgD family transcriptional regulator
MRVAEQAGAPAEGGRAMNTWGAALTVLGSPQQGVAALREAVRIAEDSGNPEDLLRGYANLGYALEAAGRPAEALAATLRGVDRSRELGLDTTGGLVLLANAASVLAMLGRWDEAEEVAGSVTGRLAPPGLDRYRQAVLAELDVGRGRFARARSRLAEVDPALGAEPQFAGPVHAVRAEAALWQGAPGEALDVVEGGLAAVAGSDDPVQVLRLCALGLRAAADAALHPAPGPSGAVGPRRRPGAEAAARLHARAAEVAAGAPLLPVPAALRALCEAEHARSQGPVAAAIWASLADRWAELGTPYPAAYARWRQGEAAVAAGERPAAVAPLAAALAAARELGAEPLRGEIEVLARAARLDLARARPPGRPAAPVPFDLTPRELEVIRLLAEGLTNRQISRRLYIAEKTAGVHVSNILRKLQARNRVQAGVVARRAGLLGTGH